MKLRFTVAMLCLCAACGEGHAEGNVCGMLEGAAGAGAPMTLHEGDPAFLTQGGRRTHGVLHVYRDDALYRVYWQPDGSAERYVLANAGENQVRLVATPPRGTQVEKMEGPGTLPPQQVLSCPAL
jgi:hypothetical protein